MSTCPRNRHHHSELQPLLWSSELQPPELQTLSWGPQLSVGVCGCWLVCRGHLRGNCGQTWHSRQCLALYGTSKCGGPANTAAHECNKAHLHIQPATITHNLILCLLSSCGRACPPDLVDGSCIHSAKVSAGSPDRLLVIRAPLGCILS